MAATRITERNRTMGDREHRRILMRGRETWNYWRATYPDVRPDLRNAVLMAVDLSGITFYDERYKKPVTVRVNLSRIRAADADFTYANLAQANLSRADLEGARLIDTNLQGAMLNGANLKDADLRGADLSGADIRNATFTNVRYNERTRWPEDFVPDRRPATSGDDHSSKGVQS